MRLILLFCIFAVTLFVPPRTYGQQPEKSPAIGVSIIDVNSFPHVTAVIKNTGTATARAWKSSNSWGWGNLSICVLFTDGKLAQIHRKQADFTRNAPDFASLCPGGELKRPVTLDDGWWEVGSGADLSKAKYFCAVYTIHETKEAKEYSVWSGVAVSPWYACQPAK